MIVYLRIIKLKLKKSIVQQTQNSRKGNQNYQQYNILIINPNNSGVISKRVNVLRKGFVDEAILCFEESINENNSRKAVTQSLLEITKIKIDQKAFYSAFYPIQREDYLKLYKSSIRYLNKFTEGVMFSMKRDYKEAIITFTELINTQQLEELNKYFIIEHVVPNNIYKIGFMCIKEYKKALQDLIHCQDQYQLDPASILLRPQDPQLSLQAGNLLFFYGDYKNAILSYSELYNIQNNIELESKVLHYLKKT
ncbi:unnamed protein product [Paramecium sonneborni]|uniref:Tetratricopeptide repeat protein n=1 Tax=Paramecium sonneborni TaxID=65129 RepID=A0A8S1RS94_9CILI|nr:unnamed protein product [Paramecium sonneborni]